MNDLENALRIGEEEVRRAADTLRRYKTGKANLERRIVDNEQWWKIRHWEQMRPDDTEDDVRPASGWLFNCIISKHADGIEAYPEPNILPREESDTEEAKRLSSIVPVILSQNDFEQVYSDNLWQKMKSGTGCYGVFWDRRKLNGLGDITIRRTDLLNLFWEPGVTDIQNSSNLFHTELCGNETLEARYPKLEGLLRGNTVNITRYIYDDTVDTSDKSVVVDWYYKREVGGVTALHFCKFVGTRVLYATENDPEFCTRGLYDHGLYPFVFDALFPCEGTPAGFGYIDVCKQPQRYIDEMNAAIIKNTLAASTPRFFIRNDGSVNEEEFADWSKPFVHCSANLGNDSIQQIEVSTLPDVYVAILNNKIEELKETSGNRDVSNGGTASGVTAASAIAAIQEQSGKTSKASTKSAYRAYSRVINICIELIRQFYTLPRQFRITGESGKREFITYSNAALRPAAQGTDFGVDMGCRAPVFDIEVSAQKASPYTKMSQNELALQLFQLGFFNPQLADQTLSCIEMMDFSRKQGVMRRISENAMRQSALIQAGENAAAKSRKSEAVKLAQTDAYTGKKNEESKRVTAARERSRQATQPD